MSRRRCRGIWTVISRRMKVILIRRREEEVGVVV